MYPGLIENLARENNTKIVLLVLDGIGGVQSGPNALTELQQAHKPNMDALAKRSICGLMNPIAPGITPGSGPAHFSLFGYDPVESLIGRGVLEAAGIGMEITHRDVATRINFATIGADGMITDRRAGRISSEECERLCAKLQSKIDLGKDVQVIIKPVKEHRAMVVLRGDGLSGEICDTDPQAEGLAPIPARGENPKAEKAAKLFNEVIGQAQKILSDEPKANFIMMRGFAGAKAYATMQERFKLNAYAIANYPMYRGVAGLLGMKLHPITKDVKTEFEALKEVYNDYDYFFMHVKYTDSRGEDGQYYEKIKVIEEVDTYIPMITALNPDVIAITGDHSTPTALASHSWHPVPVLIHAKNCRFDAVQTFDEIACIQGGLGIMNSVDMMAILLANAGKLLKFGA
jgi:2,3-bisphosphoglycerate-independent phosphoglycerate mutase